MRIPKKGLPQRQMGSRTGGWGVGEAKWEKLANSFTADRKYISTGSGGEKGGGAILCTLPRK